MKRLLVLVALLLAAASLGGSALAYARGGQAHVPAASPIADILCVAVDGGEEIVAYRPCAKKLNGTLTLCPDMPQLLPAGTACDVHFEAGMRLPPMQAAVRRERGGDGQFRPPRP